MYIYSAFFIRTLTPKPPSPKPPKPLNPKPLNPKPLNTP